MKVFDSAVFDKKTFWKSLFAILAVVALQMATKGEAYAGLTLFALFAVFNRRATQTVFWLLVSMLLIVGNGYFMPKGKSLIYAQRLLFFGIALFTFLQVMRQRQNPMLSPFRGMVFYILYMAIVSCLGWNPAISYLKLFLFSFVYLAYYCVTNLVLTRARFDIRQLRSVVLAVAVFLVVGSLAVIPFPSIGQLTGEDYEIALMSGVELKSLFKGMTNHSQMLGPVMAFVFTFLFADLLVNVRKMNALYLVLLLASPYLVYTTSSRTGMATVLMGVLVPSFCLMKMKGVGARWRGKARGVLFGLFVLAAVAVVAVPRLRESVARFAMKYQKAETGKSSFSVDKMMSSRQGLIDRQMENFWKSPVIGNGFQVSEALRSHKVKTWRDLLSASVEKGVWITAVLEEGGVCGFAVLVLFYAYLGLTLLNRGAYTGLSLLCAFWTSNMAEFTMFSMSGGGGFLWIFVFVGIVFDVARQRQDAAMRTRVAWHG